MLARVLMAVLLLCSASCAGYTRGLGYRAREAAKEQDLKRFEELMEEAVDDGPQFPGDKPVQTVLMHFLDLAGHPQFPALLARWQAKKWIPDESTCQIHRARYRALADKNPPAAQKAADAALERARNAARAGDRSWEVEACLDEAPFLTVTSTRALSAALDRAADPDEPSAFRQGLLEGMSRIFLRDPDTLISAGEVKTREQAADISRKETDAAEKRLFAIIGHVAPSGDVDLIARGTAFAALEQERVRLALGESLLARTSSSSELLWTDLTWGWIRAMKEREKLARFADLGLWQRDKEPEGDAFWYTCLEPTAAGFDAILLRLPERATDTTALKNTHCAGDDARLEGPFPLAATARHDREGKKLRLKKRLLLDAVPRS